MHLFPSPSPGSPPAPHLLRFSGFMLLLAVLLLTACDDDSHSTHDAGPDSALDGDVIDGDVFDGDSDAADDDSGHDASCITGTEELPRELLLPEPDPNGVYDPDLAWDPTEERLWMAYSGVDGPAGSGKVSTHLSFSDDRGVTWCHAGVVNLSQEVPMAEQPQDIAQEEAHWSHETPSLTYDPDAPMSSRWRLVWHRYLHVEDNVAGNEDRHFEYGWIAQRRAATPWELFEAPQEKLFSSVVYHINPAIEAYNDAVPGGEPIKRFDTDPAFGDCLAFAEPGVAASQGRLYAALFCFRSAEQQDIVLASYSHATEQWEAVGTLLTTQDAQTIHADLIGFNAADIYDTPSGWRLMVSPTVGAYLGCIEYALDLTAGTLQDLNGDGPDPLFAMEKNSDPNVYQSGACTYHHESNTGVISGDVYFTGVQFHLHATGELR